MQETGQTVGVSAAGHTGRLGGRETDGTGGGRGGNQTDLLDEVPREHLVRV